MPRFLLHHRHGAAECGAAFASFKGHPTPLRRSATVGSCLYGGHEVWWLVEADSPDAALALLPHYVASRSTVTRIAEVEIA